MILVTGPTGSGKTTTLYAALRELDTQHINVLTIEDPIEYQLPSVGQMQVKPKIGLTFAQGLRHILRQDPDVILVGETRDLETAEIVIRAALTGHLVFTTLHTNDATSAPLRLTDMGIPPYLLSSAIRASLAQRLVRSLCPSCKIPYTATVDDLSAFGPAGRRLSGARLWKAKGCPDCLGGYKGRTGLFELMTMNAELQDAIRGGLSAQEFRRRVGESGDENPAGRRLGESARGNHQHGRSAPGRRAAIGFPKAFMKTFEYRGYDSAGRACRGLTEALDLKEAREKLAAPGNFRGTGPARGRTGSRRRFSPGATS